MSSFAEILRTKPILWSKRNAAERFIIARPKMHNAEMAAGVQLVRHNLRGKRVVVKNRRIYSNVRNFIAEWPDDGLHELSKYVLVCVLDGHIDYPLGSYRIKCGPGHFLFIPPGTPHPNGKLPYVDAEKSPSCDIATFLLHPNAVECWMSHGHAQGREQSNRCIVSNELTVSLLQGLMEKVMREGNEDEQHSPAVAEVLLQAFLKLLHREVESERLQYLRIKDSHQHTVETAGDTSQAGFAERLERYVQANLRKSLSLERVSRDMYLSRAQFVRNVRRETGETFNQYLARRRLDEAKSLLLDSAWTISTIAASLGFRSTSYFGVFFRKHTGETPSDFRARSSRATTPPPK